MDTTARFACLITEAESLEVVVEHFALDALNALLALQTGDDYPDWAPVDRLGGHLARLARIANGIEREYSAAPRRLPRIAPALRVVR